MHQASTSCFRQRHGTALPPPPRSLQQLVPQRRAGSSSCRSNNGGTSSHSSSNGDDRQLVQRLSSDVQQLLATVQSQQQHLTQQAAEIAALRAELGSSSSSIDGGDTLGPLDDRRRHGLFDARFHSTSRGAVPQDMRLLPDRIILIRHAQSEGNVNREAYVHLPDPNVPLTALGHEQARAAGEAIREHIVDASGGKPWRVFFYTSPYRRAQETYAGIRSVFSSDQVLGVQEDVQLREQDFGGGFQDVESKEREKLERKRYNRFFYRFPSGESGADVYDRVTVFLDHLIRDINAGRFPPGTSLVLVTHGLALRIWLMRFFHWSVEDFMSVWNPPNATPVILRRRAWPQGDAAWVHTKAMYELDPDSQRVLRGLTPDMCASPALPPGARLGVDGLAAGPAPGGGGNGQAAAVAAGGGDGGEQRQPLDGVAGESAEQWAELGGGW